MALEDKSTVIKVDNVSKSFRLPHEKTSSIKGALINTLNKNKSFEIQNVLKNISFEVKEGEFFGIVGRNGSGKSTLLKLLAGIYSTDKGSVSVEGMITPFIELGVGFAPELTGRENVFLNGALLGFSRKEMMALYDDIVEFAELHKFMDQKLKNYSSGMQVRLAFSIAIQAKSDILILDEVLAVGDEAFQQKCVNVFERYKARKQTIVLVTHDMAVVERFCTRALMLKDGNIVKIGEPRSVAKLYSDNNKEAYDSQQAKAEEKEKKPTELKLKITDAKTGQVKKRFAQGENMRVSMEWKVAGVKNGGVAIMKRSGEYVFGPNTYRDKYKGVANNKLDYTVTLNIQPGEYYLKAGIFGSKDKDVIDFVDEGPTFIVEAVKGNTVWGGLARLPHAWGGDDVEL